MGNAPTLEMNKLMSGATLDFKQGLSSLRTSTNRNNAGIVQVGGQGTPSSNNLNSQYTLTAKKSKGAQLEVRRSSKHQQVSSTMSAQSSDNQLHLDGRQGQKSGMGEHSEARLSERTQNFMTVSASQAANSKVIAGKSLEFSPEDSQKSPRGHNAQSPYQIQSKLMQQIHNNYITEAQNTFLNQSKEASQSPEILCSLKNLVLAGNLSHTSKSKPKKKASHLSNSHQSSQQPALAPQSSDSAKQIQQIPKSQIKSIKHHQPLTTTMHTSSLKTPQQVLQTKPMVPNAEVAKKMSMNQ